MSNYEYLTDPKHLRYTILPINVKHTHLWNLYKKQQSIIWNREELKLFHDKNDFKLLDKDSQHFIKDIISFFAIFDSIVNSNIALNLKNKITLKEYELCLAIQTYMENVHGETYSATQDIITENENEKLEINNAWKKNKHLNALVQLARKWEDSKLPLGEHIVAFAFVEGVLFSGAFASIEWLRSKGRQIHNEKGKQFMQGLCLSNEFIARDEGLHVEVAVAAYSLLTNKLKEQKVKEIALDFTEAAKKFMSNALNVDLIGLKKSLLCSHIEHCANRLIEMLGYDFVLYPKAKPLEFMSTFGIAVKTNFFERNETAYQNSETLNEKEISFKDGKMEFSDDF